MRAPDDTPPFDASKDYGTYSDADWRKIEKSLGVDLDAVMVSKYPFLAPEHPEQDKAPLREALQNLANYYAALSRLKPMTRSERIDQLRQDEAALEAARRAMGLSYGPSGVSGRDYGCNNSTASSRPKVGASATKMPRGCTGHSGANCWPCGCR